MTLRVIVALAAVLSSMPAALAQSSPERNRQLATRIVEAANAGHFEALDALVAADLVNHSGAGGKSGYLAEILNLRAAEATVKMTIDEMIAEGDRVVVRASYEGTPRVGPDGPTASASPIRWTGVEILRFNAGGQLVERWGYVGEGAPARSRGTGLAAASPGPGPASPLPPAAAAETTAATAPDPATGTPTPALVDVDLVGRWRFTCCGGARQGIFEVDTLRPARTFAGKFVEGLDGTISGRLLEDGRVTFDRVAAREKQTWSAAVDGSGPALRLANGSWSGAGDSGQVTDFSAEKLVATDAPPEYLGCWRDASRRVLNVEMGLQANRTVANCVAACRSRGLPFAGLQSGSLCFCGFDYQRLGRVDDGDCSTPCGGNAFERCGGSMANSVFATGAGKGRP